MTTGHHCREEKTSQDPCTVCILIIGHTPGICSDPQKGQETWVPGIFTPPQQAMSTPLITQHLWFSEWMGTIFKTVLHALGSRSL